MDDTQITFSTEGRSATITAEQLSRLARGDLEEVEVQRLSSQIRELDENRGDVPRLQITRVKYSVMGVEVKWRSRPNDEDVVVHELASFDPPEPEFLEALKGVVAPVLKVLDLPSSYGEGFAVQTVNWKFEAEGEGVVITSLKKLPDLNAPLVLNTPYMADRGDVEEIPRALRLAVELLFLRAERYVAGLRQQRDLFDREAA